MIYRLITSLAVICGINGAAAADDMAAISLANGTDHVFTSVTITVLDQNVTLGATVNHLRPGDSVTIPLSTTSCDAVDIQAVYDAHKLLSAIVDPCDPAIYTLTE